MKRALAALAVLVVLPLVSLASPSSWNTKVKHLGRYSASISLTQAATNSTMYYFDRDSTYIVQTGPGTGGTGVSFLSLEIRNSFGPTDSLIVYADAFPDTGGLKWVGVGANTHEFNIPGVYGLIDSFRVVTDGTGGHQILGLAGR
jgi:hypothetical protein